MTDSGQIDKTQPEPSFDMIDVAPGRRLHYLIDGPEEAPFVLYDAGAFGIYADGWWIKENLKQDFRVCLYDRAGMGASDAVPDDVSPNPKFHVEDMRRLCAALGQSDPFILLGHSMAGLRLQTYANLYPEELRGLVFIDALSPQQLAKTQGRFLWSNYGFLLGTAVFGAKKGLASPIARYFPNNFKLQGQARADKIWSYGSDRHLGATRDEVAAIDHDANYFQGSGFERLAIAIYASTMLNGMNRAMADRASISSGFGKYVEFPKDDHVTILTGTSCDAICETVRAMHRHTAR
ncbi:alpha/beta hydrolase [Aquisalinus flavus]|uniref:AB hydrolase-1 domain-containing protein n=1 Tax=Aquisalinus flavus TaxID=1526572 RepID=A0A8J2V516_9PROT|nr:alpha/beta fold hydrolase [Aquisalinus flavus]MBD0426595.1 alpha/beta fold hydrolase [Aquisalinus flavus]GGD06670.1 hypothetical protein GCM10011342_14400 [Aquisalinus flavus]